MKPTDGMVQKVMPLVEGKGRQKMYPVAGVDVHKDVLVYCIVDGTVFLAQGAMSNTREEIERFIQTCK